MKRGHQITNAIEFRTRRQWLSSAGLGLAAAARGAKGSGIPPELRHPSRETVLIEGIVQDKVLERHNIKGIGYAVADSPDGPWTKHRDPILMTGPYADRVAMQGRVVFPPDERGLDPDEITIAELLKEQDYATGCFGKWHLGDQPEFMPPAATHSPTS